MSAAKFTPGRLAVCSYGSPHPKEDAVPIFTATADTLPESLKARTHVADVFASEYAALLASAPSMLAALKLAEATLSDRGRWVSGDAQEAYLACSRAIALAEGRA